MGSGEREGSGGAEEVLVDGDAAQPGGDADALVAGMEGGALVGLTLFRDRPPPWGRVNDAIVSAQRRYVRKKSLEDVAVVIPPVCRRLRHGGQGARTC